MKKSLHFPLFIFSVALLGAWNNLFPQDKPVLVYSGNSTYWRGVKEAFDKYKIQYQLADSLDDDTEHLFIIFDGHKIESAKLPKYYVIYQTVDLRNNITGEYIKKLSNAIAVWDYSKDNIKKYSATVHNYLYFPPGYEFADPVILSCFLPIDALAAYNELLMYGNSRNTDISSHLPALFCFSLLQNPQLIIECGVRDGESTVAFKKVLSLSSAHLIGIDVESKVSMMAYSAIANSQFLCMNDLDFKNFYTTSLYKDQLADVIFVDTSHQYEHTLKEIKLFEQLLRVNGILIFHDSNVTPLYNGTGYERLNGTLGYAGGNTRGVTQAIKEFFRVEFDEHKYFNGEVTTRNAQWQLIHYPFCNGLTISRLLGRH